MHDANIQANGFAGRLMPRGLACVLLLFCCAGFSTAQAFTSGDLFAPPPRPTAQDEVLLVSTRNIGTVCNELSMRRDLRCQRILKTDTGEMKRVRYSWQDVVASNARPTIIYVHGNRVSSGHDLAEGLAFYRSFNKHRRSRQPVRFVIFSWPSGQIPGPIKDYLVKAQRTNPVAWQLAWLIDQMPVDTPVSLVGYSYGARVVSGASHVLGGGSLGSLRLANRKHSTRPPVRAALIAAAFDANWIQPGQYFSRALYQSERVILGTNRFDPAMRFYHLSNGRGHMDALGKAGVDNPAALRGLSRRVGLIDFSAVVGRSHVVTDYLAAESQMRRIWHELLPPRQQQLARNGIGSDHPVVVSNR